MKRWNRKLLVVLLLGMLLSQGMTVQAAVATLPSGIAYDELGRQIEEFVSEHEDTTVGMEISVFHKDDTIYTNYFGYADKESGVEVGQDTVMEWGSTTKLLVWVSVMQLREQGQIDLDTDIREYLPEGFLTNLEYDTPVTMRNLMNHTAGFQEVYADLFVKEHDAIRSLEDSLKAHEPEQIYEPGTVTAYSNWGVALAAYVVERISGESFDDYVHQHIFEPLNMEHSALSADLSDNLWVQEKRQELQCYTTDGALIPDCFYYIALYPAGMCTSTLADFEAFGKALLNDESPLFQKKETWNTLFTPSAYLGDSNIPSNYHGFWVVPYGVEAVGHGGNTAGCSSYLLLDLQSEIGAVVMTNQSNETVYNSEMMEEIFGEFSANHYFEMERSKPEGMYRPARTVRTGPFKLMSLSFVGFDDEDAEEYWMTGTSGGVEKVCFPYADYVQVSVWEVGLEVALVLFWIVAFGVSVVSLVVKGICIIVSVCRKKKMISPLNKWNTLAAIMQVAVVVLLGIMAVKAFGYDLAGTYVWVTAVFGMITVVMMGLIIYGIRMLWKTDTTKLRKSFDWITVILLATTTANIFYWNLYMGWKI